MKKSIIWAIILISCFLLFSASTKISRAEKPQPFSAPAPQLKVDADFGKMPLYFVPNKGQMDAHVAYYVQGKDKSLYFSPEGVTFLLASSKSSEGWAVKLGFSGANPSVQPIGQEETGAAISYFKGKKEDWRTGLPTYSRLVYTGLWPGIDLAYSGTANHLKYEFVVAPGSDPSRIRLNYSGVSDVKVNKFGELEIKTPSSSFNDPAPVAYQEIEGQRVAVPVNYDLKEKNNESNVFTYGFRVGNYDKTKPLVLDPIVVIYAGYVGGALDERGLGIAVDGQGNAYITGETWSTPTTFPDTVGPIRTYSGNGDAFVAKVRADAKGLVYCSYLGGSGWERGGGIAADDSGNAYVVGHTYSDESTFPVTVGPDLTYAGGCDAFVAKINPTGTALVYCGYVGGSSNEYGWAIAIDGDGNAYITGDTGTIDGTLPVIVGPDLTPNGSSDVLVAKVKADGTGLDYCGFIGGDNLDSGRGIAVDGSGNAYVIGYTLSIQPSFPVLVGPDLTYNGGETDHFVAKVKAGGTGIDYCGYIGGSKAEWDYMGIAVDGTGHAYVTGQTSSSESDGFPVTVGPDLTFNGNEDAYVAKIEEDGSGLEYCGYIGGEWYEYNERIAVNDFGEAYVTGDTSSDQNTFPVKGGPDLTVNGGGDAFIAKVMADGTGLVYCGFIGGKMGEEAGGIAVDTAGDAYITGTTYSNQLTFPKKTGPDLTYNGGQDVFVAKIGELPKTLNAPELVGPADGASGQHTILNFQWVDTNDLPAEITYRLRYRLEGKSYVYQTVTRDSTSTWLNKLLLNKKYYWNMQAMGAGTTLLSSAWANGATDWSFTTSATPTALTAPTLQSPVNGVTNQQTTLDLEWSDSNSSPQELKYKIRIKAAGGAYTYFYSLMDATSYEKSKLSMTKTYYWNVQAIGDLSGVTDSPWGNGGTDWAFTTGGPIKLNDPVLLSPADGALNLPTTVTFQWQDTNSSPQEVKYKVRLKPAGSAYIYFNTLQDATSYIKSGLAKNKTYYWNVQAFGNGTSILNSDWANDFDWTFRTGN